MTFDHLAAADAVAAVAARFAPQVDEHATFPTEAIAAARERSLLGLTCAAEVGGLGLGLRHAAEVVERVARECGSTAMVMTMHYAGASVIEAHGSKAVRREVASGRHLSTLAFSESGSRSHFWAPLGTARSEGDAVVLDAHKSWITAAHHANGYVWSSRPVGAEGLSTLWLVPRDAAGLAPVGSFQGLGLRGNDSVPVTASAVRIPAAQRLGPDGGGFGIMMGAVLPAFSLLSAASSVGMAEAAVQKSAAHCAATRYEHLPEQKALADLPTIRAYLARMRIHADMARALWQDSIAALETGREDAMLRVLEVKAGCAEAAREVLDVAMRVCGGMAFRKDVGVERRFRDTRAALVMAPTSDQLYDFIGKAICGQPLF
jgi:alkylation response protein AidB-like acyl-CoA dehydrogenase